MLGRATPEIPQITQGPTRMAKRELLKLPPDFAANVSALLRTPPPPKDKKPAKPKARKGAKKR
jgi:hypothetical protein